MNYCLDDLIRDKTSYVSYRKAIRDADPLLDSLLSNSPYKYAEALYQYMHGLTSRPTCECGTTLTYIDRTTGYRKFCSTKCAANSASVQEKRTATKNLYPAAGQQAVTKRKSTMVDRYGVEHALQNPVILQKRQASYAKLDQTEILAKRKKTMSNTYGADYNFNAATQATNIEKYGVSWVQQDPTVKSRSIQRKRENFYNQIDARVKTATPMFTATEFAGVGHLYNWKCNTCSKEFVDHIDDGSTPVCLHCFPKTHTSSLGERELVNFLQTECGIDNISQGTKTVIPPKEIDIFLPDHQIAIEYNGLYWHSEKKISNKLYHQEKWQKCATLGIRLIQIFEDEWKYKTDIVKSRIKHILGQAHKVAYARQCTIAEIDVRTYQNFLNATHIQGATGSKIRYGAFFNNELVAVMGFSTRPIYTKDAVELVRFAVNGSVPGIASKLLKRFIKDHSPTKIISYCDLRWGDGKLYTSIGMQFDRITTPGYWYSKDGINRHHRSSFTKKKLAALGHIGTEASIMELMGYYRIWDAGNKVFSLDVDVSKA